MPFDVKIKEPRAKSNFTIIIIITIEIDESYTKYTIKKRHKE